MEPIFELPRGSLLAAALSEDFALLPLRVPAGWHVVHNQLDARRLPDGRVQTNDSEDLYWARTARPPWLTEEAAAGTGGLFAREINMDAGWYGEHGFRVVVLDPDWDHVAASCATSDLVEFVSTLERWMSVITTRDELPGA